MRDHEDLHTINKLLQLDHKRLAALHERQAAEYEALIAELEHKVEGGAETHTQKHTLRWGTIP